MKKSLADEDQEDECRECEESFLHRDEVELEERERLPSPLGAGKDERNSPGGQGSQYSQVSQADQQQHTSLTAQRVQTKS